MMNKDIEYVLKTQTIGARYQIVFAGWLDAVSKHRCLISGKIPQNPVVLNQDGGLYERKILQSIIDEQGGYFESPKTANMITITETDLEPTAASMFIAEFISDHFQLMWMFKGLRHTSDQDKLLDLLCTKGPTDEDELEMRAQAINKIISDNPQVVQFKLDNYFGVRSNNLLELMCIFPLVQKPTYDNRCITSDLFYSTINTLKQTKTTRGNHKSLFAQLRHQLFRQSDRDFLAQSLRDRISDLLSHPNQLDMEKIKLLQSCGASLLVSSSGGLSLLHKVLKNDLNDVVKVFLRSEKLPIQELQATFKLAVDKIHLTTSTELIQVLYNVSVRYKEHVQLDMFKIIEHVFRKYLENEQGQDEPKWAERLDLVINLLPERKRREILNSTLTVGEHESMSFAWHAVNAKMIWLLDCLLCNGAKFYIADDLPNSAIYRAIELGDDLKLQLMFELIRVRRMYNFCDVNLYYKKTEKTLLRLAYSIENHNVRETVYRTLFTGGISFHDSAFSLFMNSKSIKRYFKSIEHERANSKVRVNRNLRENRYGRGIFHFSDIDLDVSYTSDNQDSEDREYEAYNGTTIPLERHSQRSDNDSNNSPNSATTWIRSKGSPESDQTTNFGLFRANPHAAPQDNRINRPLSPLPQENEGQHDNNGSGYRPFNSNF